jgi:NADP-dependent aldehyde dehydrogenase
MTENEHARRVVVVAARPSAALAPGKRAQVLRAIADDADASAGELVPLAEQETRPSAGQLTGEPGRTAFQLRLFAETGVDGGHLGARIEHADTGWSQGSRPDLRRAGLAWGPVVVFSAANFPFGRRGTHAAGHHRAGRAGGSRCVPR